MDQQFVLRVLETMTQMLEVLVARIELMERKLNEACSCKQWAANTRPDVIFEPCTLGADLTQGQIDELLARGVVFRQSDTSEIMPQG